MTDDQAASLGHPAAEVGVHPAWPTVGLKFRLFRPLANIARAVTIALLLATLVDVGPSTAAEPAQNAAVPTSVLDYYPAKARAAGVEGTATLKCGMTDRHVLQGCSLLREEPKGWGFGDAAMALVKRDKENAIIISPTTTGAILFVFDLHPPAILPDAFKWDGYYITPDFLKLPEMSKVQGMRAANGQAGRVVLDCVVGLDHRATGCSVVDSTTSDSALGDIALRWAKTFLLRPMTIDGKPRGGGHVVIPLSLWGPR